MSEPEISDDEEFQPSNSDNTTRVIASGAMHSYQGWLQRFFQRLFGPIVYDDEQAEKVRALAKLGTVIYIARAKSPWLVLYFNHALSQLGLPLARFIGGVNVWIWQPLGKLWAFIKQRRVGATGPWRQRFGERSPTNQETTLAELVDQGKPAFICIHPSRRLAQNVPIPKHDYVRALISVQKTTDKPIFLVPHALIDHHQSGTGEKGIADRLFGDARNPGRLRQIAMLLSSMRNAMVRVGDPINLQEFVQDLQQLSDRKVARRVRHELNRRLTEEERVVAGPRLPNFATTARHVLRDPALTKILEETATLSGDRSQVRAQAVKYLKEIAARYDVRMVSAIRHVLTYIFHRIYDGIVVDEQGLKSVIDASRKGPLILCPCHRSHVDYLVLSYVLWEHGITPPHIAAGVNLSFFPLGTLFRRAGAFFIRRTFRDNPTYAAVFRAYVSEILTHGTSIEFFLEGTRSRTGKLLMPKFGLLSMLVDSWRHGARDDLQFVPISIDYERIIEAGAYEKELKGGKKKAEDISGLLSSTSVLRSRYGRVHVQFGDPISLQSIAKQRGLPQSADIELDEPWRKEVEKIGYRVLHQVAMVCSATPTSVVATALLGHSGRGVSESMLLERCRQIIAYLGSVSARLSASLVSEETRNGAIVGAVRELAKDGQIDLERAGRSDAEPIYMVPDDKRVILDYHKNSLMNYFASAAMVARGIRRADSDEVAYPALFDDVQFLSRLFKREFLYRADSTFSTYFDDALAALALQGVIEIGKDKLVIVKNQDTIEVLAGLLDSFVQAYWVTGTSLRYLQAFPLWNNELADRALDHARRAYLEGSISRPETASRTLVNTALDWYENLGAITAIPDGKKKRLSLSDTYQSGGIRDLVDRIATFL